MIKMKCPECNANLEFEEGRTFAFCSYCGTKLLLTENSSVNYLKQEEEHLINSAIQQLRIECYDSARHLFDELCKKFPSNIIGYLGSAKMFAESVIQIKYLPNQYLLEWDRRSKNGSSYILDYYSIAYKLSSPEIACKIKQEYEKIFNYITENFIEWEKTEIYKELNNKISKLSEEIEIAQKEVNDELHNKWRLTNKKLDSLNQKLEQLREEYNNLLHKEMRFAKLEWENQVKQKPIHIPDILGDWGIGIDC